MKTLTTIATAGLIALSGAAHAETYIPWYQTYIKADLQRNIDAIAGAQTQIDSQRPILVLPPYSIHQQKTGTVVIESGMNAGNVETITATSADEDDLGVNEYE